MKTKTPCWRSNCQEPECRRDHPCSCSDIDRPHWESEHDMLPEVVNEDTFEYWRERSEHFV